MHDVDPFTRLRDLMAGTAPEPTWRSEMSSEYRVWQELNGRFGVSFDGATTITFAKCGQRRSLAARFAVRQRNGVTLISTRCAHCGAVVKTQGATDDVHLLPLWHDHTDSTPCARCGSQDGVELHHWAPRHLFEDADKWPVSELCRPCHQRWHALVTPYMSTRKATA
jgi:hypothetical protein